MKVLKQTVKTSSRIELANMLIDIYCITASIKISKKDSLILSYLAVYGFKKPTKDIIIRSKVLNSYNSIENTISKLRKLGLITKDPQGKNILGGGLNIPIEKSLGVIIKLENI